MTFVSKENLSYFLTKLKSWVNAQLSTKQNTIDSDHKLSSSLVSGLSNVATSGNYNDLSNKPAIPTVNNATLTIQKNGANVSTFTANASANVTANITVPTKTSDLTNDSGYITSHQDISGKEDKGKLKASGMSASVSVISHTLTVTNNGVTTSYGLFGYQI